MENPNPPPGGEDAGGLVDAARKFLAACAQWAAARLRLVSAEGKDAGARLVKLLVLAGSLVFIAALGWLFVCLALVFLLAEAIGGTHSFVWASLIIAGVHLAATLGLAFVLKGRAGAQLFPLTSEELKKDQAWLEQMKEKP